MTKIQPELQPEADKPRAVIHHARVKALWGQRIAAAAIAALLLNAIVEYFTATDARVFLLMVQSIPLLLFVPGMLAKHHRTYSWLCFVVLFYFIVGVTDVMSPLVTAHSWVILIASVALFNAAMMTSRWLQYLSVNTHH